MKWNVLRKKVVCVDNWCGSLVKCV